MNRSTFDRWLRFCAAALLLGVAGGCGSLLPKPAPPPSMFALDRLRTEPPLAARGSSPVSSSGPTLMVGPPRAAAGFDSRRMVYVREAHRLEVYAHSEWVDTPARMLAPLIVAAVETGGRFRAVVPTASAAAADIRLDTEIVRLQQQFDSRPSRVRFALHATLVEHGSRRVLAWREFDETVAAASDDPEGGVAAANRAVQIVLGQLAAFCDDAAALWRPPPAEVSRQVPTRPPGN